MINTILSVAIVILLLISIPLTNGALDVTLEFANYKCECSIVFLSACIMALIALCRIFSWIMSWPCRHKAMRINTKIKHSLQDAINFWLEIMAGEPKLANNILKTLHGYITNGQMQIMEGIVLDKLNLPNDAISKYNLAIFSESSSASEKTLAVRIALGTKDIKPQLMHELIIKAESLSSDQWLAQAKFNLYIKKEEWLHALGMLEGSMLNVLHKKCIIKEEASWKAILCSLVAEDYHNAGNEPKADKYWSKAIKYSNSEIIQYLYCEYLYKISNIPGSMNQLYSLFEKNPDQWFITAKYLEILSCADIDKIKKITPAMHKLQHSLYGTIILLLIQHRVSPEEHFDLKAISEYVGNTNDVQKLIIKIAKIEFMSADNFFSIIKDISYDFICPSCTKISKQANLKCNQCGHINAKINVINFSY